MEITQEIRATLNETKAKLSGYACRQFMAQIVKTMFGGSQAKAEKALGWNRVTMTKALAELEGGFGYIDQTHQRGRKRAEEHLPNLLADIGEIAERHSQTDPTFRTTRAYTRLTTAEVRQQLLKEKEYSEAECPCEETIRTKLNELGYGLKRVKKVNH
jgi:hypothetical protein